MSRGPNHSIMGVGMALAAASLGMSAFAPRRSRYSLFGDDNYEARWEERRKARLAKFTLEEIEERWVQDRLYRRRRKAARAIQAFARHFGSWPLHPAKDQSSSLKRMLKKARK